MSDTPSDDAPDNVLRPSFGEPRERGKQTEIKHGTGKCYHRGVGVELDDATRAVTCEACGAPLDAFMVLLQYANRERNWRYYDRECEEKRRLLAELKEEERKVKARTASASRKDAAVAVAHERQATFVRRQTIADKARDAAELMRQITRLARIETEAFVGVVRRKREGGK